MSKAKAGTGRVTPQKVRAVLRKAGYHASQPFNGNLTGRTSGYQVAVRSGWLIVEWWNARPWARESDQRERQTLESYRSAIAAAGIACKVRDGAVWVQVEEQPR